MKEPKDSIFRRDALQRYAQSRDKAALPQFASPHTVVCLWLLLGLLVGGGALTWLTPVPVYAQGQAVIVDPPDTTGYDKRHIIVAAFLPPENLTRLRVGQAVLLKLDAAGQPVRGSIIAVEPGITSPAMAQRRFALRGGAALAITQPAAVAVARLGPIATGLPTASYKGGVYHVDIEVGTRRVASLLPLLGRVFGDNQ